MDTIKNISEAFKSIFRKGQHNVMKIISLATGFAVGLVLISKAAFERSYDNFYRDSDRIWMVMVTVPDQEDNTKNELYPRTAGGVAPYLRMLMPEVETATRFTYLGLGSTFTLTESKEKFKADYAVADSCLFDILTLPILQGNPKEVLGSPLYAMVSETVARNIGGDAVGKTLVLDGTENAVITVGGVFRDFPGNSIFAGLDMFISMPSISYYTWDGSMNLIGNDRYFSLIKLRENADISHVQAGTDEFIRTNFADEIQKSGMEFGLTFRRLDSWHASAPETRNMVLMLSLIAFALIFTAAMNYILLALSQIIGRSKEMAVCRCYGATSGDIRGILMTEAFVHTFIALILGILIILAFGGTVEKLVGTSPKGLFLNAGALISAAVCLLTALISGFVPGIIYSRIPVATALRNYRESKRHWKLALLSIQFAAAAFLIILLIVISGQYRMMSNDSPGYEYGQLAYTGLSSVGDPAQRSLIIQELSRLPEVEAVTYADVLPMHGTGGDNVMLPGDSRELFNCADMYFTGKGYFDLMEIPIIQGRAFNEDLNAAEEVMVSRKFVEFMQKTAGWDSDVIGREICVTSFNGGGRSQTICGVYEDFRIGSILNEDRRPSVIFYNPVPADGFALVKFHRISPEAISKAEALVSEIAPDKDLHIYSYRNDMAGLYAGTRNFRDAVMTGGFVTLLIVFIGLTGYTSDETGRRRKEIAIRKINGAGVNDIERLMTLDVIKIAIPSVTAGAAAAFFTASGWLGQFSEKTSLAWYIFLAGAAAVIVFGIVTAACNVRRTAGDNPANSLKNE